MGYTCSADRESKNSRASEAGDTAVLSTPH